MVNDDPDVIRYNIGAVDKVALKAVIWYNECKR